MIAFFLPESALLVGVILTLAVLFGAELYLRIKYRNLLWIRVYPQVYVPDQDLGYRYVPNASGRIRVAGIHRRFHINKQGFPGRDFSPVKPPGTYRIALVGTSNTTGIWVHGQGKNYGEMLEDRLRASGRQVDVLNFGIDGRYRAVHQIRIIETDVAAYRPDLILLELEIPFVYGFFQRDVYQGYVMIYNPENQLSRQWCEAEINYVRRQWLWIGLYYTSYIVRAAVRYYMNHYNSVLAARMTVFVENRIQAPDVALLPYSLKKSVEALQAARNELGKQGTELMIMQYFANPYYRAVTSKYGLPYLELNVPPVRQYVHDRDGHYRYEGHEEIAKQLYDRLTSSGIFESRQSREQDEAAAPVPEVAEADAAQMDGIQSDPVATDTVAMEKR